MTAVNLFTPFFIPLLIAVTVIIVVARVDSSPSARGRTDGPFRGFAC
jgi:hypothetical protein